jgi:predicted Zn-dependent protease
MTDATARTMMDTCDRVLDAARRIEPAAEVAVSAVSGPDALTRFAGSFIHQNVAEDQCAVQVKVVLDGRATTVSTTRTDDDGIERAVRAAVAAARLRPPDPDWAGLAPEAPAGGAPWDDATAATTPAERAAVVRAFVDAGHGLEAAGFVATSGQTMAFANTAGQRALSRSTRAAVDGIHRSAAGDGSGRQASARIADLDGAAAGSRAASKARAQDDAIEIEPGAYEVVLEPSCVGDMLLFLRAMGFNAKVVQEGMSFVHLGEQQFDAAIDMWDDASDPRTIGHSFDAEGTPKRRVDLVKAGVTTEIVHDRRTAKKAGTESTGHSLGDDAVGPFPTNVFVGTSGPTRTREELIASVERGLLVTDFHYTRILDPKTQVVTGLTRNGVFLIEDGKIGTAVKNLRFTQSYVGALGPGKVLGVGDDGQVIGGMQMGNGSHVPSLHLASWNFTGGARG